MRQERGVGSLRKLECMHDRWKNYRASNLTIIDERHRVYNLGLREHLEFRV